MKQKAPIFIAAPRSRSTALFSLAARAVETKFSLKSLGQNTEFFNEWSWRNFCKDTSNGSLNNTEYFPINKPNGLSHHYVYPPILSNKAERNNHKVKVLKFEKKMGREYNIKIMAPNLFYRDETKYRYADDVIDFFGDRKFVITRRRDVKGLALSLLVATHTQMWHKRETNTESYDDLYENPITINPELCTVITPDLQSLARLDGLEESLAQRKYDYEVFYYEDMSTVDDMKNCLDIVFETDSWRQTVSDEFIEKTMTQDIKLDYRRAIANYDKLEQRIDATLNNIFE